MSEKNLENKVLDKKIQFPGQVNVTLNQVAGTIARLQDDEIIDFLDALFKAVEQDAISHQVPFSKALQSLVEVMAEKRAGTLAYVFEHLAVSYNLKG